MTPPAQVFECDCNHFCGGTLRPVGRSTFYNHQPYRHQLAAISPAFLAGHAASTDPLNSSIRGTEPVGQRPRLQSPDMVSLLLSPPIFRSPQSLQVTTISIQEPHASGDYRDPEDTRDGNAAGSENEDNDQGMFF